MATRGSFFSCIRVISEIFLQLILSRIYQNFSAIDDVSDDDDNVNNNNDDISDDNDHVNNNNDDISDDNDHVSDNDNDERMENFETSNLS